jgi:Tfp pilus assembly protein PilN
MSLPAEKPAVPALAAPAAPHRAGGLNLARRPFVNTRPVTRVSLLLWLLGFLLLFGNVSLFWSYLSGSAEKRDELERLEQDVQRQQQTVSQLEQRLASLALEQQNRQVLYLNRKIEERTFSWSLLFDRIAGVLPNDVRLTRLAPRSIQKGSTRKDADLEPSDGRVQLVIQGMAKSDEDLLAFVDRLFAHDSFDEPDLSRETRAEENDPLEFDVRVIYTPGGRLSQETGSATAPVPEIIETPAPPPAAAPPASTPGIDE